MVDGLALGSGGELRHWVMMEAGFYSLRACLEASEKQRMSPQTLWLFPPASVQAELRSIRSV